MNVDFRNGIVLYQFSSNNPNQPTFLSKTGSSPYNVNLLTNVKDFAVTISHGVGEYLVSFFNDVVSAWSFNDSLSHYLYIDVDNITGEVTHGSSLYPIIYGNVLPGSPDTGQNFFHTGTYKTLEWTGSSWINKIRVFVGQVSNVSLIQYTLGTVTGSNAPYTSGPIIYSGLGKGVLKQDKTFLTTSERFYINNIPYGSSTIEQSAIVAKAANNLAANRFVKLNSQGFLDYAQPADVGVELIFTLTEPLNIGEVTYLPVGGVINNGAWNWSGINTPLYVGENGVISETDPILTNGLLPRKPPIARTLSANSIIVNVLTFIGLVNDVYVSSSIDWVLDTVYNDKTILVNFEDRLYKLVTPHTSTSTFDYTKWILVESLTQVWQPNAKYYSTVLTKSNVIYNDEVYFCNDEHISTGSFDITKWTKVSSDASPYIWSVLTANTVVESFSGNVVQLTSGNVTITLPLTATINDEVIVSVDTDLTSTANRCTIDPNGNLLKGQSGNVTIDVNNTTVKLVWVGGALGWAMLFGSV